MDKSIGILETIATRYGVFISDLRLNPQLRQAALRELQEAKYYLEGKKCWDAIMLSKKRLEA